MRRLEQQVYTGIGTFVALGPYRLAGEVAHMRCPARGTPMRYAPTMRLVRTALLFAAMAAFLGGCHHFWGHHRPHHYHGGEAPIYTADAIIPG